MALLVAKTYDPATAVIKFTTALLAMTALDTTNLRNTFTVPANGAVMVHIQGTVHGGSATPFYPQILLGVLESATVRGRVTPVGSINGTVASATLSMVVQALFVVSGLTPSASLTWDAAYGVEVVATGSAIKYGGPNNTTTNDAFGAMIFEVWSTS